MPLSSPWDWSKPSLSIQPGEGARNGGRIGSSEPGAGICRAEGISSVGWVPGMTPRLDFFQNRSQCVQGRCLQLQIWLFEFEFTRELFYYGDIPVKVK
jgi:hypothetical protein